MRRSISRRGFMQSCAAGMAVAGLPKWSRAAPSSPRRFNLSISIEALEKEPDRITRFAVAGGHTVWLPGFFYGHWPVPLERVISWRKRVEAAGLECQMINIPLGHPGDALGSSNGEFPLTPPGEWRPGRNADGSWHSGTSHHPPATEANAEALKQMAAAGVTRVFVDDDFRLAPSPGMIGGCFCDEHKSAFLNAGGLKETDWATLLDHVHERTLSPLLRQWVEFTCDELTGCFRTQQAAAPGIELGNMIMYFGAEKAGIRLNDYRNAPFRVGELMFDDRSFNPVKGKTNELFSVLFHRRFASPEKAYSETTAYPADKLSANNMAAKLVISTIADVHNTMFMSGLTPFPMAHWDALAPAMKEQAAAHAVLAGHKPQGPMKHYWGEPSRYVGDDNPFSLFLALGIPFEASETPPTDGWTFLSDADACWTTLDKTPETARFFARPDAGAKTGGRLRLLEEDWEKLCALKQELLPELGSVPHLLDNKPAVLAWYPSARAAMIWNLAETAETFTLRLGGGDREIAVAPLKSQLVQELPVLG